MKGFRLHKNPKLALLWVRLNIWHRNSLRGSQSRPAWTYAFGLILFEMSTGCRPWKYDNMGELVVAHMTKIPPKINQVASVTEPLPVGLEALVASCLEKDPAKRPESMKEVADKLSVTLGTPKGIKRSPEMMMFKWAPT